MVDVDGPGQTSWRPNRLTPETGSLRANRIKTLGLSHYRQLIHLRLSQPALRLGRLVEVNHGGSTRLISYGREWQVSDLVLHNISRQSRKRQWGKDGITSALCHRDLQRGQPGRNLAVPSSIHHLYRQIAYRLNSRFGLPRTGFLNGVSQWFQSVFSEQLCYNEKVHLNALAMGKTSCSSWGKDRS